MNNSISPKEIYNSLMAVCGIVLALSVKVLGDDPIIDIPLLLIMVILIFNFAYKARKAKGCTSEQKSAVE